MSKRKKIKKTILREVDSTGHRTRGQQGGAGSWGTGRANTRSPAGAAADSAAAAPETGEAWGLAGAQPPELPPAIIRDKQEEREENKRELSEFEKSLKEKGISHYSAEQLHPTLQIWKQPDGTFTVNYKDDPLKKRSDVREQELDGFISSAFPDIYSSWEEYKKDNRSDLTRKTVKTEDSYSAPTAHPFHVALGLDEFKTSLAADQYEIVAMGNTEYYARASSFDNEDAEMWNNEVDRLIIKRYAQQKQKIKGDPKAAIPDPDDPRYSPLLRLVGTDTGDWLGAMLKDDPNAVVPGTPLSQAQRDALVKGYEDERERKQAAYDAARGEPVVIPSRYLEGPFGIEEPSNHEVRLLARPGETPEQTKNRLAWHPELVAMYRLGKHPGYKDESGAAFLPAESSNLTKTMKNLVAATGGASPTGAGGAGEQKQGATTVTSDPEEEARKLEAKKKFNKERSNVSKENRAWDWGPRDHIEVYGWPRYEEYDVTRAEQHVKAWSRGREEKRHNWDMKDPVFSKPFFALAEDVADPKGKIWKKGWYVYYGELCNGLPCVQTPEDGYNTWQPAMGHGILGDPDGGGPKEAPSAMHVPFGRPGSWQEKKFEVTQPRSTGVYSGGTITNPDWLEENLVRLQEAEEAGATAGQGPSKRGPHGHGPRSLFTVKNPYLQRKKDAAARLAVRRRDDEAKKNKIHWTEKYRTSSNTPVGKTRRPTSEEDRTKIKQLTSNEMGYYRVLLHNASKRKLFFGEQGNKNEGILYLAFSRPEEGLDNTDLIDKIRDKYDFKSLYLSVLEGEHPIKHPNGQYWARHDLVDGPAMDPFGYTDNVSDAVTINITKILDPTTPVDESFAKVYTIQEAAEPARPQAPSGAKKPELKVVPGEKGKGSKPKTKAKVKGPKVPGRGAKGRAPHMRGVDRRNPKAVQQAKDQARAENERRRRANRAKGRPTHRGVARTAGQPGQAPRTVNLPTGPAANVQPAQPRPGVRVPPGQVQTPPAANTNRLPSSGTPAQRIPPGGNPGPAANTNRLPTPRATPRTAPNPGAANSRIQQAWKMVQKRAPQAAPKFLKWAAPVARVAGPIGWAYTAADLSAMWFNSQRQYVVEWAARNPKHRVFRNRDELEEFQRIEKERRSAATDPKDQMQPVDFPLTDPSVVGEEGQGQAPEGGWDAWFARIQAEYAEEMGPADWREQAEELGAGEGKPEPAVEKDPAEQKPPEEVIPPRWPLMVPEQMVYFLMPAGWSTSGEWLTEQEKTLAKRVAANIGAVGEFLVKSGIEDPPAAPEKPSVAPEAEEQPEAEEKEKTTADFDQEDKTRDSSDDPPPSVVTPDEPEIGPVPEEEEEEIWWDEVWMPDIWRNSYNTDDEALQEWKQLSREEKVRQHVKDAEGDKGYITLQELDGDQKLIIAAKLNSSGAPAAKSIPGMIHPDYPNIRVDSAGTGWSPNTNVYDFQVRGNQPSVINVVGKKGEVFFAILPGGRVIAPGSHEWEALDLPPTSLGATGMPARGSKIGQRHPFYKELIAGQHPNASSPTLIWVPAEGYHRDGEDIVNSWNGKPVLKQLSDTEFEYYDESLNISSYVIGYWINNAPEGNKDKILDLIGDEDNWQNLARETREEILDLAGYHEDVDITGSEYIQEQVEEDLVDHYDTIRRLKAKIDAGEALTEDEKAEYSTSTIKTAQVEQVSAQRAWGDLEQAEREHILSILRYKAEPVEGSSKDGKSGVKKTADAGREAKTEEPVENTPSEELKKQLAAIQEERKKAEEELEQAKKKARAKRSEATRAENRASSLNTPEAKEKAAAAVAAARRAEATVDRKEENFKKVTISAKNKKIQFNAQSTKEKEQLAKKEFDEATKRFEKRKQERQEFLNAQQKAKQDLEKAKKVNDKKSAAMAAERNRRAKAAADLAKLKEEEARKEAELANKKLDDAQEQAEKDKFKQDAAKASEEAAALAKKAQSDAAAAPVETKDKKREDAQKVVDSAKKARDAENRAKNADNSIDAKKAAEAAEAATAEAKRIVEESEDPRWELNNMRVLVFGHSQTDRLAHGLVGSIKDAGGVIPGGIRRFGGESDRALVERIQDVEDAGFTHAYLFLGGNTRIPGTRGTYKNKREAIERSVRCRKDPEWPGCVYKIVDRRKVSRYMNNPNSSEAKRTDLVTQKEEIIRYVNEDLNVDINHITVILPPINEDNVYSKSREIINKRAEELFISLGVNVHPLIIGSKKDFAKDGYHIQHPKARGATYGKDYGDLSLEVSNAILSRDARTGPRVEPSDAATPGRAAVDPVEDKPRTRFDARVEVPYQYVQENLGLTDKQWDMYRNELHKIESGARPGMASYRVAGGAGGKYDGRYQIGPSAKLGSAWRLGLISTPKPEKFNEEDKRNTRPDVNGIIKYPVLMDEESRRQFRDNPSFQEKLLARLTFSNNNILKKLKRYEEAGAFEKLGILGYAHNQGASDTDPKYKVTFSTSEAIEKFGGKKKAKSVRMTKKKFNEVVKPFDPGATISKNPVSVSAFRWLQSDKKLIGHDAFGSLGTKYYDNIVASRQAFERGEYNFDIPQDLKSKKKAAALDRKIIRNKAEARKINWIPEVFGEEKFDEALINSIEDFQKSIRDQITEFDIRPDGIAGPKTAYALIKQNPVFVEEFNIDYLNQKLNLVPGDLRYLTKPGSAVTEPEAPVGGAEAPDIVGPPVAGDPKINVDDLDLSTEGVVIQPELQFGAAEDNFKAGEARKKALAEFKKDEIEVYDLKGSPSQVAMQSDPLVDGDYGTYDGRPARYKSSGESEIAKRSNRAVGYKGKTSKDWGYKEYNAGLTDILGAIPVGKRVPSRLPSSSVTNKWNLENLVYVKVPLYSIGQAAGSTRMKVNKHIVKPLLAAIMESQAKYGLPIQHSGAHTFKGTSKRYSSHVWGAAVDFDSISNYFTPGGMLGRAYQFTILRNRPKKVTKKYLDWKYKKGKTGPQPKKWEHDPYGDFTPYMSLRSNGYPEYKAKGQKGKNRGKMVRMPAIPKGMTWGEHLQDAYDKKVEALPVFMFVAGPPAQNGIADIFAKYGFFAGMMYTAHKPRAEKDTMHFEYLPYQKDVKRRQEELGIKRPDPRVAAADMPGGSQLQESKFLSTLFSLIDEIKKED